MPLNRIFPVATAALLSAALAMQAGRAHAAHAPAPGAVKPSLAALAQAHTFAQVREGEQVSTLFVVTLANDAVHAINLSDLSGLYSADAFDVINRFDVAALDVLAGQPERIRAVPADRLIGVGPRGLAHIAAGTNYPAHGKEVGMNEAFLFPKLSPASGPRSALPAAPAALMDYEVEVCARFDRELRNLADFDAARKGLFLCGDFTDRATLVRNINLRNVTSGDGFADAKSGPGRFPAGPFLVVPRDWRAFLGAVTIATYVNGERRQFTQAGDMIKDLRTIVAETLAAAGTRTWSYQGRRIPMTQRGAIPTDTAVLTGTGEGVVFKAPDAAVMREVMSTTDRARQVAAIDRYLAGEAAKAIYLQPGDHVRYTSKHLGEIHTEMTGVVGPAR